MKKLIIYGLGSQAENVFAYFDERSDYEIVAFTVEAKFRQQDSHFGIPVYDFENIEKIIPPSEADMFIAVGPYKLGEILKNYCEKAKEKGYSLASFFTSPFYSKTLEIHENSFIYTTDFDPFVEIGKGVSFTESKIGHHTKIGNYVFMTCAIIGAKVVIEDHVFIGIGSIVKSGVKIAKGTIIGMGCIITQDTEPYSVYSMPRTKPRDGADSREIQIV